MLQTMAATTFPQAEQPRLPSSPLDSSLAPHSLMPWSHPHAAASPGLCGKQSFCGSSGLWGQARPSGAPGESRPDAVTFLMSWTAPRI